MRQSAVVFNGRFNGQHSTRFGKSRLRFVFTMEGVTLSCGSALLQPTNEGQPPTISLTWTSGRKKVFGGVVRALPPHEGSGARWPRPVSMACSLTSNKRSANSFEARHSTIMLRIEGSKAARRKLVGTLDLAQYASYERTSTKLTIPLEHGAGSLQLDLTSGWLKKSMLDDEDGSEASMSSRASDSVNGDGSGSEEEPDIAPVTDLGSSALGASIGGSVHNRTELTSLKEESEGVAEEAAGARMPTHDEQHGAPPPPRERGTGLLRSGSFDRSLARKALGGSLGGSLGGMRRGGALSGTPPSMHSPSSGRASAGAADGDKEHIGSKAMVRSNSFGATGTRGHRRAGSAGAEVAAALKKEVAHGAAGSDAGEPLIGAAIGRSRSFEAGGTSVEAAASAHAPASAHPLTSMFNVPLEAMEEVLSMQLPLSLDEIQESFAGFDTDDSHFGVLLSRRLGYMDVQPGSWSGNEAEGMTRQVRAVGHIGHPFWSHAVVTPLAACGRLCALSHRPSSHDLP